eukprot:3511834-Alexandrium_andersonii.AAC.1
MSVSGFLRACWPRQRNSDYVGAPAVLLWPTRPVGTGGHPRKCTRGTTKGLQRLLAALGSF